MQVPYKERIGYMLVKFLNIDLTSFETAYDTFFNVYGFELLKDYAPYEKYNAIYENKNQFISGIKKIYEESLDKLYEIKSDFKEAVDYIYNLDDTEYEGKARNKFLAYSLTHSSTISKYQTKIDVKFSSYTDREQKYINFKRDEIVKQLEDEKLILSLSDIYSSESLGSILFVILNELSNIENMPIRKCTICGRYFIPTARQDEVYCDFKDLDLITTCRERGATQTYKKRLESVPALQEYRRLYQKKIMFVTRNKGNKELKKEFDKWKKEIQLKIKEYKNGNLKEEELYKFITENS